VTDVKTLHTKIEELALENDFSGALCTGGSVAVRKKMTGPAAKLSRQAAVPGISAR
jgi:hypothetical protein